MLAFSTKSSLKKINLCYQKKWILNALLHSQVQWDIYACMRPSAEWSAPYFAVDGVFLVLSECVSGIDLATCSA